MDQIKKSHPKELLYSCIAKYYLSSSQQSEILTQRWFIVCPPSTTLAQQCTNIGSMSRVSMDLINPGEIDVELHIMYIIAVRHYRALMTTRRLI